MMDHNLLLDGHFKSYFPSGILYTHDIFYGIIKCLNKYRPIRNL
ncbi:Uncharacterised protein [Legionella spiritensis]|nr:Uncharacterised protein [Legionella spiritensis]